MVWLYGTIFHQPEPVCHQFHEAGIVAYKNDRAVIGGKRLNKGLAGLDIKVVGRLSEVAPEPKVLSAN